MWVTKGGINDSHAWLIGDKPPVTCHMGHENKGPSDFNRCRGVKTYPRPLPFPSGRDDHWWQVGYPVNGLHLPSPKGALYASPSPKGALYASLVISKKMSSTFGLVLDNIKKTQALIVARDDPGVVGVKGMSHRLLGHI